MRLSYVTHEQSSKQVILNLRDSILETPLIAKFSNTPRKQACFFLVYQN